MLSRVHQNHRRESGFTLIELMIVVAIIGILAAVAVPQFLAYRNKARTSAVMGFGETIRAALAAYAVDDPNNGYPTDQVVTDESTLVATVNENGGDLPEQLPFTLASYTPEVKSDVVVDYTIWLKVTGVEQGQKGYAVLVTSSGIDRCSELEKLETCVNQGTKSQ